MKCGLRVVAGLFLLSFQQKKKKRRNCWVCDCKPGGVKFGCIVTQCTCSVKYYKDALLAIRLADQCSLQAAWERVPKFYQ